MNKVPKTADSEGGRKRKGGNDDGDEDDEEGEEDEDVEEQEEIKEEDLAAALKASEEEEQSSQNSLESGVLFEASDADEDEFVPRPRSNTRGDGTGIQDDNVNDNSIASDDDSVVNSTRKTEMDAQAIGFGSSDYQQNLLDDKIGGVQRKSSLTGDEKLAIAVAEEEEEKKRKEANETEELRLVYYLFILV